MLVYIFDGSFEGLLTAIYEAYYRRQIPEKIITPEARRDVLFAEYVVITTDKEKSEKVYHSIQEKISYQALHNVYCTFLSGAEDCYTWIYNYLKLGWEIGSKLDSFLTNEHVHRIHTIVKKVNIERHRMLGLIRFKQLNGNLYYASCEPDNNIVGLIAPHFAQRFSDQNWIIHDVKRDLAAVYNQQGWFISELSSDLVNLDLDNKEAAFQQLWKKYFDAIAIKNRINPKLQKSFMPVRYWKHLIEK